MEQFDAIVVGGGLAGAAAAYRMAKEGVKVLLVERGSYGGAKNMTGGRIYTHSLEELIPDFRKTAPLERKVTKERISILEGARQRPLNMKRNRLSQKTNPMWYCAAFLINGS